MKTNYKAITEAPPGSLTVRQYAEKTGQKWPNYIYVAYNRYLDGKGKYPGYDLVNFGGVALVIPVP